MPQSGARAPVCRLCEVYVTHPYQLKVYVDRQLLERDPNKRLGYRPGGGGFEDIKKHTWFKGINWAALHNKEVIPPFEPDVSYHICSFQQDN
jgi:hypothetical protein